MVMSEWRIKSTGLYDKQSSSRKTLNCELGKYVINNDEVVLQQ